MSNSDNIEIMAPKEIKRTLASYKDKPFTAKVSKDLFHICKRHLDGQYFEARCQELIDELKEVTFWNEAAIKQYGQDLFTNIGDFKSVAQIFYKTTQIFRFIYEPDYQAKQKQLYDAGVAANKKPYALPLLPTNHQIKIFSNINIEMEIKDLFISFVIKKYKETVQYIQACQDKKQKKLNKQYTLCQIAEMEDRPLPDNISLASSAHIMVDEIIQPMPERKQPIKKPESKPELQKQESKQKKPEVPKFVTVIEDDEPKLRKTVRKQSPVPTFAPIEQEQQPMPVFQVPRTVTVPETVFPLAPIPRRSRSEMFSLIDEFFNTLISESDNGTSLEPYQQYIQASFDRAMSRDKTNRRFQ